MTPAGWAQALENVTSKACVTATVADAITVARLLAEEPDRGVTSAWRALAAFATDWLAEVAKLSIPRCLALPLLDEAIRERPPSDSRAAYLERMQS